MEGDTERLISDSLETEPKLLPFMPFLLQDLWALGCSLDSVINSLRDIHINSLSTVLDLGCGKGALSINIAAEFGCRVTGVDAMVPFLDEAEKKAIEYNVNHLCNFIYQDINSYVATSCNFDYAVLASLGGVFGSITETVRKLRTQVKPYGYILIDDGYLKTKNSVDRKGYAHYRALEESIKELTSQGDKFVKAVNTDEECTQINNEYIELIKIRGKELIEARPELEKEVNEYIALQEEETKFLSDEIEGTLWILQKVS